MRDRRREEAKMELSKLKGGKRIKGWKFIFLMHLEGEFF
jgi:hypothetical protein